LKNHWSAQADVDRAGERITSTPPTARSEASGRANEGAATLQQKAVIFTESRRTQEYLFRILEQTEFAGKVMLFNGTNSDPTSKAIYRHWQGRHAGTDRVTGSPIADMRAALVEHFRNEAAILIATEAAAEGINLQFCNLVVNYDLSWCSWPFPPLHGHASGARPSRGLAVAPA